MQQLYTVLLKIGKNTAKKITKNFVVKINVFSSLLRATLQGLHSQKR